jgi:DNA primase catalytic core
MSLKKLSAGDGYRYLTRQVAAGDATHIGHISLGAFYAARGESPGIWAGAGLSGLEGVDPGDYVSAEQMRALFGEGRHPNADTIASAMIALGYSPTLALRASALGLPFKTFKDISPFRSELAKRCAKHSLKSGLTGHSKIAADARAQIRRDIGTEMFIDWHGRPPVDDRELAGFIAIASRRPMSAVAGFDLTFSPVKSVSTLWALASPEVAAQIQKAQHGAVADTLSWLERDAAFTRTASASSVRHVEVTGLIATIFSHRDARSGDPDLHTHMAVSNKVQTLGGTWKALNSRVLFKARVAASERYNTRIEAELTAQLGVRFHARNTAGTSGRAIREIIGVDPGLNAFWSSRTADILVYRDTLEQAFQVARGRAPNSVESGRLAQQATLATRPAKHSPRSYSDQRAAWRAQARQVLGGDVAVEAMIATATGNRQPPVILAGQVTQGWVTKSAADVVARISISCPTWQVWLVRAEAERVAATAGVALVDLNTAVDRVVASALAPVHAVRLAGPQSVPQPDGARRSDGSSMYSMPGATRFTSRAVMDAGADDEDLFHAARQREYSEGPDLDEFETEQQLVEANQWDHATVPRARLVELNQLASDFFTAGYANSWGPAYVRSRLGTDLADHSTFRPGYAPAGWTELVDHLRHLGASDEEILAAGLGRVASTGLLIDQFRGRLMLPIRNGEAIHGFIGRCQPGMDQNRKAGPKYLNTPRTDLFDKSQQLFGLTEGKTALEAGAAPVLVEGFFDAIAVTLSDGDHHVGLASLGTSFTMAQANQLRPYIGARHPGVTVATDADLAGQIAAERAFWMLAARGDSPRHVLLVGGTDPAEIFEHRGPAALRTALYDAQPLSHQLLQERLRNIANDDLALLAEVAAIIAAQPPHTWGEQIDYAANRAGASHEAMTEAVAGAARRWTRDALGGAAAHISALSEVRARLVGTPQMPSGTGKAPGRRPAAGSAAERTHLDTRPSEPQSSRPMR